MPGKTLAVVQSNYIPWKGYFDLINMVDEFILLDDVQYTKRDWRNRNLIKTQSGLKWLTIPVQVKGKFLQTIKETRISDVSWGRSHWKTIVQNYSKARHFKRYADIFERLYLEGEEQYLSRVNFKFINAICYLLGIKTKISFSMEFNLVGEKTERLVALCEQAHTVEYISGPAARSYLNEELFKKHGIAVRYIDYSGYPEHQQQFLPFEHRVSIIDLIFNEGPNATKYMRSF